MMRENGMKAKEEERRRQEKGKAAQEEMRKRMTRIARRGEDEKVKMRKTNGEE